MCRHKTVENKRNPPNIYMLGDFIAIIAMMNKYKRQKQSSHTNYKLCFLELLNKTTDIAIGSIAMSIENK